MYFSEHITQTQQSAYSQQKSSQEPTHLNETDHSHGLPAELTQKNETKSKAKNEQYSIDDLQLLLTFSDPGKRLQMSQQYHKSETENQNQVEILNKNTQVRRKLLYYQNSNPEFTSKFIQAENQQSNSQTEKFVIEPQVQQTNEKRQDARLALSQHKQQEILVQIPDTSSMNKEANSQKDQNRNQNDKKASYVLEGGGRNSMVIDDIKKQSWINRQKNHYENPNQSTHSGQLTKSLKELKIKEKKNSRKTEQSCNCEIM